VAMVAIFTVAILISTAFVATAIRGTGLLCSALRFGPLVWVGEISYGLYIWHRIPGNVAESLIGSHPAIWLRLVSLACEVAISIAAAAASFYWFERPVRRWLLAPPKPLPVASTFPLAAINAQHPDRTSRGILDGEPIDAAAAFRRGA
jgi:peptidoglycan/LPS O-acetylase OafA/YrhL